MIANRPPAALVRRIVDGLERLGAALQADRRGALETTPLNPTQARILGYLTSRGAASVGAVAAQFGVRQPTATGSLAALEKKGLVERHADAKDRRVSALSPTQRGAELSAAIDAKSGAVERALSELAPDEQSRLLELLVRLIRILQREGAIPPQRMCVTCAYFRPYARADAEAPHHCAFVDAAFGGRDLRLDCGDHREAENKEEVWMKFLAGAPHADAGGKAAT
jgi:DNA-binding MarR family transcriptional regulator